MSVNLSRNHLSGQLPNGIGNLKSLDALDLSNNHIWAKFLDSYDILELPYEQSSDYAFSMYIFLSHAKTGLKDLVAEFNSDPAALLPMNAHLENEELEQVSVPKTKLSHDFDAKEGMKAKRLTNFFFLPDP